jgi:hypothetical protein
MLNINDSINDIGMKILWGLLILATVSLLASRQDSPIRKSRGFEAWTESTVVNATASDGGKGLENEAPQRGNSQELDELRDRIRFLEAEVAVLKRQNHAPGR